VIKIVRQIQPSESVSEAVVKAVSAAEDRPLTSLPPLYNAIKPKALNKIFTGTTNGGPNRSGHITFQYSDSVVTVGENGYLAVQESLRWMENETFYR
jgi:hypothetical protein